MATRKQKEIFHILAQLNSHIIVIVFSICITVLTYQVINLSTKKGLPALTSNDAVTASVADNLTDFAYPRGTKPAYGWYDCGAAELGDSPDQCINDEYTVIHDWYGSPVNGTILKSHSDYYKNRGRAKQILPYTGYHPNRENNGGDTAYWESVFSSARNLGLTDNDVLGFYYGDEPHSVNEVKYTSEVQKKYFPNALAVVYGVTGLLPVDPLIGTQSGFEYIPYVDVAVTSTYENFESNVMNFPTTHATTYLLVKDIVKAWNTRGKTIWHAPETFQGACEVGSDPNLSSRARIYNKITSEIILSTAAGAQGILPYSYFFVAGRANGYPSPVPECYTAIKDFLPKYTEIWPWIMAKNRTDLPVTITNGNQTYLPSYAEWPYRWGAYPRVIAKMFTDNNGRKMILTTSLLSWKESSSVDNATIANIPNGSWEVLWENRTVNVTNGTISDSWAPYGYHIYVQSGYVSTNPTQPPLRTESPIATVRPSATPMPTQNTTTTPLTVFAVGGFDPGREPPVMEVRYKDTVVDSPKQVDNYTNTFIFNVPVAAQIQDIKIAFTNDTSSEYRDLRVDYVILKGVTYKSEAAETYSTGTWTEATECTPGFKKSVWLHCNGYLQYNALSTTPTPTPTPTPIITQAPTSTPRSTPSPLATPTTKPTSMPTVVPSAETGSLIVKAAGSVTTGITMPTFEVRVKNISIGSRTVTGQLKDYIFSVAPGTLPSDVKVVYTNDMSTSISGVRVDRDLRVDGIVLNGITYPSDASDTYSTGTWTSSDGCAPGFKKSVWLHCGGYFEYKSRLAPIRIQAESFNSTGGYWTVSPEEETPGVLKAASYIYRFDPKDWIKYNSVNISGKSKIYVRIAPRVNNGTIEVRTNNVNGELIGKLSTTNADSTLTKYTNQVINITPQNKVVDLYLISVDTFEVGRIDWIELR